MQLVEQFLQKHLATTPQKSIPEKIKHWLFVANNPATVYPDADAVELNRRRRNARNNVRRLAAKHVHLLPTIARELEAER